jgi:hypothetical protein
MWLEPTPQIYCKVQDLPSASGQNRGRRAALVHFQGNLRAIGLVIN